MSRATTDGTEAKTVSPSRKWIRKGKTRLAIAKLFVLHSNAIKGEYVRMRWVKGLLWTPVQKQPLEMFYKKSWS